MPRNTFGAASGGTFVEQQWDTPMDSTLSRLIRIATRAGIVVAVLVVGILVFLALKYTAPKPATTDPDQSLPRAVVLTAAEVPVQRRWQGYGTARAVSSANVPARVTATVVEIPDDIDDGAPVSKGQLLVRLDDSDFRRQFEIAQQNLVDLASQLAIMDIEQKRLAERLDLETKDLALARTDLERVESLVDRSVSNPRELDAAKRSLIAAQRTHLLTVEMLDKLPPRRQQLIAQQKSLQSSADLAEQSLDRCRIVSPLDGVLQSVDVEVGENVVSGQSIARVVDLRRIELPLRLPASARADVAIGNIVLLTATNQTKLAWQARVSRIAPEDDVSTRTATVFVQVDQPDAAAKLANSGDTTELLSPGVFLAGVVTSDRTQNRWVLPRRSVRNGRIFVVEGNKVYSREAKVDFLIEARLPSFGLDDDQWAVLDTAVSTLQAGDLVLVNASASVQDGDQVEPVPGAASQTASRLSGPARTEESRP